MPFQGSGTGAVTYQISNENPVSNASCKVQALEDDGAGMLSLNVSFEDKVHGAVQVGISVFDYSPQTAEYKDVDYLSIGFNCQIPLGGWASASASSVFLDVNQSGSNSAKTYTGVFNAQNLLWQGSDNQDSIAIKFANFRLLATSSA